MPLSNLPSIPRNRSRENIADLSSNRIREKNLQLKKQHAEVSRNVARALEKVNKAGLNNLSSVGSGNNLSARNLISKPRSQSVDRVEKPGGNRLYDRDRMERVESRERVERERVSREKENRYRILVPPINRPPSRNNLSKKYLPPSQPKAY